MERYKAEIRRNVSVWIIATAVFGPFLWMLLDREPPYTREPGYVERASLESCGLPPDSSYSESTGVYPGGCAEVRWKITPKRVCPPSEPFNVSRDMEDSQGRKWNLGPIRGVIGVRGDSPEIGQRSLSRYFAVPATAPLGPAIYNSEACFVCNPVQHAWPICVTSPGITFEITTPPPVPDTTGGEAPPLKYKR